MGKKWINFLILLIGLVFVSSCQSERLSPRFSEKILEGRAFLIHIDDFENFENSEYMLVLDTKNGFVELNDLDPFSIPSGSKLRVRGTFKDGEFLVSKSEESVLIIEPASDPPGPEFNLGENKILVLLGEYDDAKFDESDLEDIEDQLFGDYPSMDDFYRASSADKSWFDGDIFGPFNLGTTHSLDCIDALFEKSSELMEEADPLVDFTNYKRILFVSSNCYGGMGHIGAYLLQTPDGDAYQSWSWVGYPFEDNRYLTHVSSHELGHNFGALHASYADCTGLDPAYFGKNINCRNEEYGNIFSVMGHGDVNSFTATHKQTFGWLTSEDVVIVGDYGIFTLFPLAGRSGTKRIVIPYGVVEDFTFTDDDLWDIPAPEEGFYSIEYRQPNRYDQFVFGEGYGVFITFNSVPTDELNPWWFSFDHLIYPYRTSPQCPPNCFSLEMNSALHEGESYIDENLGIEIKVGSVVNGPDGSGITIEIKEFNGYLCDDATLNGECSTNQPLYCPLPKYTLSGELDTPNSCYSTKGVAPLCGTIYDSYNSCISQRSCTQVSEYCIDKFGEEKKWGSWSSMDCTLQKSDLINNCQACGCPGQQICTDSGVCVIKKTTKPSQKN